MTTYLGKSCSFCLPRVPFVNCRQFMYWVVSLLVLRAGYGIWLYQFLIIAYLFTLVLVCPWIFGQSCSSIFLPSVYRPVTFNNLVNIAVKIWGKQYLQSIDIWILCKSMFEIFEVLVIQGFEGRSKCFRSIFCCIHNQVVVSITENQIEYLRNRSALAVYCWALNHGLEVSCKEEYITSAMREWYICLHRDLLFKHSFNRADLFWF